MLGSSRLSLDLLASALEHGDGMTAIDAQRASRFVEGVVICGFSIELDDNLTSFEAGEIGGGVRLDLMHSEPPCGLRVGSDAQTAAETSLEVFLVGGMGESFL